MDDLKARFQYQPPRNAEDVAAHQSVNDLTEKLARDLSEFVPRGREHALMLTNLEQARMWANAALAHARAEVNI